MSELNDLDALVCAANSGCDPNLHDDALIYQGSSQWDDWENHIPIGLAALWSQLSAEARKAAFLVAKSITHYEFTGKR